MAAYRRAYDSRHLQADCQESGSAPPLRFLTFRTRGRSHIALLLSAIAAPCICCARDRTQCISTVAFTHRAAQRGDAQRIRERPLTLQGVSRVPTLLLNLGRLKSPRKPLLAATPYVRLTRPR